MGWKWWSQGSSYWGLNCPSFSGGTHTLQQLKERRLLGTEGSAPKWTILHVGEAHSGMQNQANSSWAGWGCGDEGQAQWGGTRTRITAHLLGKSPAFRSLFLQLLIPRLLTPFQKGTQAARCLVENIWHMAKQQWLPSSQTAWPSRCPSLLLSKGKGRGRQGTGESSGEQMWELSVGVGGGMRVPYDQLEEQRPHWEMVVAFVKSSA